MVLVSIWHKYSKNTTKKKIKVENILTRSKYSQLLYNSLCSLGRIIIIKIRYDEVLINL